MNGTWKNVALTIIGLLTGTVLSSGYMSCQYTALAEDLKVHEREQQVERVDLEGRLQRIETLLEGIKEDIRK
jgi:hypothetical protein